VPRSVQAFEFNGLANLDDVAGCNATVHVGD
jgi:hypothetical protein